MSFYRITNQAGHTYGDYQGGSPAEALLTMHRDAGYGPAVVILDGDRLRFVSGNPETAAEYARMCGNVEDFLIEEVTDPRELAYEDLCRQLGFDSTVNFVVVTDDGRVSFSMGKPDEVRALKHACTREGFEFAEGDAITPYEREGN